MWEPESAQALSVQIGGVARRRSFVVLKACGATSVSQRAGMTASVFAQSYPAAAAVRSPIRPSTA